MHFPEGERRVALLDDLPVIGVDAVPARVPGNVALDLVRASVIPDPFYADNVCHLRPFESDEWWYIREFTIQGIGRSLR